MALSWVAVVLGCCDPTTGFMHAGVEGLQKALLLFCGKEWLLMLCVIRSRTSFLRLINVYTCWMFSSNQNFPKPCPKET